MFNDSSSVTWYRIAAIVIVLLAARSVVSSILHWEHVPGWEAYWIAQAIADGEGYSMPSIHGILFDDSDVVDSVKYRPTAWIAPFYTYCLAGLIWMFGDFHQLAAAIFNLFLFSVIFFLVYHLTERLISSQAALITVAVLALSQFPSNTGQMNGTLLAACFILLTAAVLVNFFARPCLRNAALLGVVLGLTVLASPVAQYFLPVVAISILFWYRRGFKSALLYSVIVSLVSVAVIAPWTIRNYVVFDEYIPVRSGAGQIIFIGVVAAAATVMPEIIPSATKPDWRVNSTREAVMNIKDNRDRKRSLIQFQIDYAKELIGVDQWSEMDEVQRDKWFSREAKEFMHNHPLISIQLAIAKIEVFATLMGMIGLVVLLLAILGALVNMKKPAVSTLALCAGLFIAPFFLVIAFHTRYRAPIEPILTLLAVFALYWIFSKYRTSTPV